MLTMAAGHLERRRAGTAKVAGTEVGPATMRWPGRTPSEQKRGTLVAEASSCTSDQLGVLEQFVLVEDSLERR